ncbi:hypothetical protein E6O75_ATG04992 [Venturia nashicola]|uniref:Uncharacterized protein n=1 Tax=Venturia nashicola TaxID=86259 RepID=A0A4Z1PHG5_9PEZI|nr:hypothetical protein E6O75_ATG04992 [Venturia nashicola]
MLFVMKKFLERPAVATVSGRLTKHGVDIPAVMARLKASYERFNSKDEFGPYVWKEEGYDQNEQLGTMAVFGC